MKLKKRKKRKIPVVLTEQEQIDLLAYPKTKSKRSALEFRNYCILRMSLDTGTRCAETLSVKIEDINWTTGELKVVQGKGGKDRIIWINQEFLAILKEFLNKRTHPDSAYLFTSGTGKKLSPSYIRQVMPRYRDKANIKKNISYHTLRHTFATDLYRKTQDIRLTQDCLGHSSINTTLIYTHIASEEKKLAMTELRGDNKATNETSETNKTTDVTEVSVLKQKVSELQAKLETKLE